MSFLSRSDNCSENKGGGTSLSWPWRQGGEQCRDFLPDQALTQVLVGGEGPGVAQECELLSVEIVGG